MRDEMIDKLENILKTVGDGLLCWRGNAGGEWHGAQLKTEADREACPDRYWLIDLFDGFKRNAQTGSGRLEQ